MNNGIKTMGNVKGLTRCNTRCCQWGSYFFNNTNLQKQWPPLTEITKFEYQNYLWNFILFVPET